MKEKISQVLSVGLLAAVVSTSLLSGVATAAEEGWPRGLHITAPSQGPKYFAPLALSGVLEVETGMKVRVIPDDVHYQRLMSFREGDFDIYVDEAGGPLRIMQGKDEHANLKNGPLDIRIMWPAVIEAFAPMLRGDTKLKTFADLKNGFTFAAPPGATPQANCHCIAAWAGVSDDQWKLDEYGSMGTAVNAIPDGKADMVWWIPDAGPTYEAETKPKGLSWLELDPAADPEGAARALELCPQWMFGEAPETSVASAKGKKVALLPTYFFVLEDMDADLVYKLVKFTDENNAAVVAKHPSTSSQSLESFKTVLQGNFIPLHEGTIRYLKEKGAWSDADQKMQNFNVQLFQKYIDKFAEAAVQAKSKDIKPVATNEKWIALWESYKADLPVIKSRTEIPKI